MNTPHTHIWCEFCHVVRPIRIVDTHDDDVSGQFGEASDLCCGVCGLASRRRIYPRRARSQPTG